MDNNIYDLSKTIRVYGPNTKEYQRLEAAAKLINAEFEKNNATARVSDEWFDYPGGIRWTTLMVSEHQVLNPQQQRDITDGTLRDFTGACATVIYLHRERMSTLAQIRYGLTEEDTDE